ncbi:MAG TPA: GlxA family transcriptional regulator [Solirubrobacteraceae bacterium]|nr:GlxA family transcriptional regulator [Solirubrobacteraceae bacterium]
MRRRQIVLVAYPGVQSLDVSGPYEVFAGAERLIRARGFADRGYSIRVVAPLGAPVRCESGLLLTPDAGLEALAAGPIDTLLVAGGGGSRRASDDLELVQAIAAAAPRARRVASVCTGAFLLARAGLLSGRRATTHWAACGELAAAYPDVHVDPDPIFTRDGNLYTSAGVTAGMDLALALVEDDLGRDAALEIARWLVMFVRRPGNQSQFSAQLQAQLARRDSLRELQRFVVEHPEADLSVEAMAARAWMSPRHFARMFVREVGVTPARYVERVRIDAARRQLEDRDEGIGQIAAACGFGTAETMRRAFLRALGVSPAEYRRRFQPTRGASAA